MFRQDPQERQTDIQTDMKTNLASFREKLFFIHLPSCTVSKIFIQVSKNNLKQGEDERRPTT